MRRVRHLLIGLLFATTLAIPGLTLGGGTAVAAPAHQCFALFNPEAGNFLVFTYNTKTEQEYAYTTNRPPRNCEQGIYF